MNKHTTKRALVASILALAMCFSMLVGTTLAWFTDSATSTGNVIETGTLKVDLEVLAEDNSAWSSVKAQKTPIFNYTNWEPGFVQLKLLRVENEGSLALKWKATLSSENGVSELADVIDVYVKAFGVRANDNLSDVVYPTDRADVLDGYTKVGTLAQFIADIESTTNGTLLAGEKAYLGIAFKMQDTADDYYQAMTLGAFDVKILAAQLAYEGDSFDNGYDAGAEYDGEITNTDGLKAALEAGGSFLLKNDVEINKTTEIAANTEVTIDLNGNSLIANNDDGYVVNNDKGGTLILTDSKSAVTYARRAAASAGSIEGVIYTGEGSTTIVNGGIYTVSDKSNYIFLNDGGTLIFNGGTVNGGGTYPIYSYNGGNKLIINDVTVNGIKGCVNAYASEDEAGYIEINGGIFNFTGYEGNTYHIAYFSRNMKVVINDGIFAKIGDVDLSGEGGGGVCAASTASVAINGGIFTGSNKTEGDVYSYNSNAKIAISAGTFTTKKPSASMLVAGYKATETENGWVVSAAITSGDDLQAAIASAKNGEVITLVSDIEITNPAYGQNALNVSTANDITIDLNGHTIYANTGNSVLRFNIKNTGAISDVTLTLKNGTIISGADTWCTVMAAGISSSIRAVMNLENMTIENSKPYDLGIKAWEYSLINANGVTVNSTNGAGAFYAVGGEIVLDDCTVNQSGIYTDNFFLSAAVAVSNGGKATINSGSYSTIYEGSSVYGGNGTYYGNSTLAIMSSGGTIIVNGGTFTNGNSANVPEGMIAHGIIVTDAGAVVEINGGTFNALTSAIEINNNTGGKNPSVTVNGGSFNTDPRTPANFGGNLIYIADGMQVVEDANGRFTLENIEA